MTRRDDADYRMGFLYIYPKYRELERKNQELVTALQNLVSAQEGMKQWIAAAQKGIADTQSQSQQLATYLLEAYEELWPKFSKKDKKLIEDFMAKRQTDNQAQK